MKRSFADLGSLSVWCVLSFVGSTMMLPAIRGFADSGPSGLTAGVGRPVQELAGVPMPIPTAKLVSSDVQPGDLFGFWIATAHGRTIVGAPGDDDDAGAAFFFVREGNHDEEVGKLLPMDRVAGARFGWTTAISDRTAVVSAVGLDQNRGAAYVFRLDGRQWVEEAKLVAPDGRANDLFGWKVAISGTTVVVGAPGSDSGMGAAYIFRRQGDIWGLEARLAEQGTRFLGSAVAIEDDVVFVGASETNENEGTGLVFVRDGTTWTRQSRLTPDAGIDDKFFGNAAAISGNTLVVGADEEDSNGTNDAGATYVFVRSASSWQRQAKLTLPDAREEDHFGLFVAISGEIIVVGAPTSRNPDQVDSGWAYVFLRQGGVWTERGRLGSFDLGSEDEFGHVAIDGTTAFVGAALHDGFGEDAGAAYVYDLAEIVGARASAVQVTPDGRRILLSKDVEAPTGIERWAITRNLDDETITGNVFTPDGGSTSFVFCVRGAVEAGEVSLECSGAAACGVSPCLASEWAPLGTIRVPVSFLEPPAGS